MIERREIRHFHIACGLGGGARGFNRSAARVGSLEARYRCVGGVDVDPVAIDDFQRLTGVPGSVMDLFDRQQYIAFHGKEPPADWREATPADMQRAAGGERPHIVFTSMPCKGFSGLLSESRSKTEKYQALNRLAVRGTWLALEAWKDDPVEFYLFENVPRIQTRGRHLLDQIVALLTAYGYAVAETTHDCGELGGLAQSRKRFLLVARHKEKVPPFLYEPEKRTLRAVGDVLGAFPMPGAAAAGPMHRMPNLQWKTWVRLAFVEAGSDWRSLQKLKVKDGVLSDFAIVPEATWNHGALGVNRWEKPVGTVTGNGRPAAGAFAVADPMVRQSGDYGQLGVREWDKPTGTVSGQSTVGGGAHAIADPRLDGVRFNMAYKVVRWDEPGPAVTGPGGAGANIADPRGYGPNTHHHVLNVTGWDEHAMTITASRAPGGGAQCVADPRVGYSPNSHRNKLMVADWNGPARTVTGANQVQGGALSVADPRAGRFGVVGWDAAAGTVQGESLPSNGRFSVADPRFGDKDWRSGPYGVLPWSSAAYAVTSSGSPDNGFNSVADPRLPAAEERLVCVIRAIDGTWHRPFTTLELAALQGLVDPGEFLELEGLSDSAWRERIGNAVPSPAAEAIGSVMGRALLGAWSGETFSLSSAPIWVRPLAIALATHIPNV